MGACFQLNRDVWLAVAAFASGSLLVTAARAEETASEGEGEVESSWLDQLGAVEEWFGLWPAMADAGVTIEPWIIIDWSQNWHGGVNTQGSAFRHLFGGDITLDAEKVFGIPGGTLFAQYQNQNGEDGSLDTGDFQIYSNIDADGLSQVSELWYEQRLLDDRLRIKIGKVDANTEFNYVDHGAEFIHSSVGFTPALLVFPTYPDPATSVNVFAYPTDWSYLGFGLYDGALHNGFRTGSRGPSTFGHEDFMYLGEGGAKWLLGEDRLDGRLGLGAAYHTGTFERFDGDEQNGTGGFYLVFDQLVQRENPADAEDEQGVGVFVMYGRADPDVTKVDHHVSAGLAWTGPIDGRDHDVFGLGMNYVHFSQVTGSGFTDHHETAYELFYKIEIAPQISIKPDLQYIVHPGGNGLPNAFVATLRMEISL
jgi:porin